MGQEEVGDCHILLFLLMTLNKHGVDEEVFNNEIWDLLIKF